MFQMSTIMVGVISMTTKGLLSRISGKLFGPMFPEDESLIGYDELPEEEEEYL